MPKKKKGRAQAGQRTVSKKTTNELLLLREKAFKQWRSHRNKSVETFDIWSKLVGIHPDTVRYLRLKRSVVDDGKLDQEHQNAITEVYDKVRQHIQNSEKNSPNDTIHQSKMQNAVGFDEFRTHIQEGYDFLFAVGFVWPSKLPVIDKATAADATAADATAADATAADEAAAADATQASPDTPSTPFNTKPPEETKEPEMTVSSLPRAWPDNDVTKRLISFFQERMGDSQTAIYPKGANHLTYQPQETGGGGRWTATQDGLHPWTFHFTIGKLHCATRLVRIDAQKSIQTVFDEIQNEDLWYKKIKRADNMAIATGSQPPTSPDVEAALRASKQNFIELAEQINNMLRSDNVMPPRWAILPVLPADNTARKLLFGSSEKLRSPYPHLI